MPALPARSLPPPRARNSRSLRQHERSRRSIVHDEIDLHARSIHHTREIEPAKGEVDTIAIERATLHRSHQGRVRVDLALERRVGEREDERDPRLTVVE